MLLWNPTSYNLFFFLSQQLRRVRPGRAALEKNKTALPPGVAGTILPPTHTHKQLPCLHRLCFHSGITVAESIETRATFALSVWSSRCNVKSELPSSRGFSAIYPQKRERERSAWRISEVKATLRLEKLSVMTYWATSHGWSNAESLSRLPHREHTRLSIPWCSLYVGHKFSWRGGRAVLSFWWMNGASAHEPIIACVNNVDISNVPSGHNFQNKRLKELRGMFFWD